MNDMIECPELGTGQVGLPGASEVPRNAYDALQRCAAQWPDREGVVFPLANERLSFAQWLLQSNRLATALRRLGVGVDHLRINAPEESRVVTRYGKSGLYDYFYTAH